MTLFGGCMFMPMNHSKTISPVYLTEMDFSWHPCATAPTAHCKGIFCTDPQGKLPLPFCRSPSDKLSSLSLSPSWSLQHEAMGRGILVRECAPNVQVALGLSSLHDDNIPGLLSEDIPQCLLQNKHNLGKSLWVGEHTPHVPRHWGSQVHRRHCTKHDSDKINTVTGIKPL